MQGCAIPPSNKTGGFAMSGVTPFFSGAPPPPKKNPESAPVTPPSHIKNIFIFPSDPTFHAMNICEKIVQFG